MATAAESLPLSDVATPTDQAGVAEAVRVAHQARQPVYPLGGGTAQDYGHAPSLPGLGLDLTGLAKIVDYTPRDMTIFVEAGVRIAHLAATLDTEGQHLPIDVPRARDATLGGVVATNWSGPRRFGYGTMRDYVIGIHAVDGRGIAFKGGGRVVKNVAGYDLCKLLTGSLGTLGVITQIALKVKPRPEQSATLVAACADLATADKMLNRLVHLAAPPIAIDLLIGPAWQDNPGLAETIRNPKSQIRNPVLVVRVEGTESEVTWLSDQVQCELRMGGGTAVRGLTPRGADTLWDRQLEFADRGAGEAPDDAPLVLKIAVPPSGMTATIAQLLAFDADCTVQAHAGNGIVVARLSQFRQADLTPVLVGKLRPAAVQRGGSLVVLSSNLDGLTPHLVWGGRTEATMLMERIQKKFDPHNILNPGRFVF